MKVPVGPSTVAVIVAALAAAVAFVTEWVQTGSAPVWLAALSGALVAILNVARSYQAGLQTKFEPGESVTFVTGEIPDFPELDD
jgi:hypothetical protein